MWTFYTCYVNVITFVCKMDLIEHKKTPLYPQIAQLAMFFQITAIASLFHFWILNFELPYESAALALYQSLWFLSTNHKKTVKNKNKKYLSTNLLNQNHTKTQMQFWTNQLPLLQIWPKSAQNQNFHPIRQRQLIIKIQQEW